MSELSTLLTQWLLGFLLETAGVLLLVHRVVRVSVRPGSSTPQKTRQGRLSLLQHIFWVVILWALAFWIRPGELPEICVLAGLLLLATGAEFHLLRKSTDSQAEPVRLRGAGEQLPTKRRTLFNHPLTLSGVAILNMILLGNPILELASFESTNVTPSATSQLAAPALSIVQPQEKDCGCGRNTKELPDHASNVRTNVPGGSRTADRTRGGL